MTEPVDPVVYAQLFEGTEAGQRVLDELVNVFGGVRWVAGGPEASREQDRRIGRHEVVQHILAKINEAHGVREE